MPRLWIALALLATVEVQAANGRYLTWVDDHGRVHNTFVDSNYGSQQRAAAQRISQADQARLADGARSTWPGAQSGAENKRRYFTWVDATGNLQSSFYAGAQQMDGQQGLTLPNGQHSSDYIDAEAFEGRQVLFSKRPAELPGLDGQPNEAMKSLLEGSQEKAEGLYQGLQDQCCGHLAEGAFTELSADEPRYQELNGFSPSFDFPMGRSYYAALKLPTSQHTYGLRVRSFANKQVVYPSLLFLDERKQPTRLVSDAVYQLHGETWYRYAFIEGTVPVNARQGERYVLLLTTDEDRKVQTLDNKPFKRPLQALPVNESGMQVHQHAEVGAFEVAIVR
jgi:hypothetical protein